MSSASKGGILPCRELLDILLPVYSPCHAFSAACETMRWAPKQGHIPRGFCGATGSLDEVELVLIAAEPGDPHPNEDYSSKASPREMLLAVTEYAYSCYETGTDLFHRNVRKILNLFWPGISFREQMRKTWITESVFCSAKKEGGNIPARVWKHCKATYLHSQLDLFPNSMIVALGSKARDRAKDISNIVPVFAAAPPGCNFNGAEESWMEAAKAFRKRNIKMEVSGTGIENGFKTSKISKIGGASNSGFKKKVERAKQISMKSNSEKLQDLVNGLAGNEMAISEKLGKKILELGEVEVREGNKTYDLAFRALEKKRKPSFAAFITNTHKEKDHWNVNEVPDSLVVQVRFRSIYDPDKTNIPKEWYVSGRWCDPAKGWFAFHIKDSTNSTIEHAFKIVKEAYDSL